MIADNQLVRDLPSYRDRLQTKAGQVNVAPKYGLPQGPTNSLPRAPT